MPIPSGPRPFDTLAAEIAADELAASPVLGSVLGLTEYDPLLPDLSADAVERRESRDDAWVERLQALDDTDLDDDERIDRDLVLMVLRGRAVMRDWAEWRRSADVYASMALTGVHVLLLNRLTPPDELARSVAARLRAVPALLAHGEANLDPSLAEPTLLRRSMGQVQAGSAYARAVPQLLGEEVAAEILDDDRAAGDEAAAAFERFGAFLADLAGRATGEWAIGEERYDALLRVAEGLSYGTRELRQRGQAAYDELAADMRARAVELRGTDDWRAVLTEISLDAPETAEELLAAYREATALARAFCIDHDLVTVPDGERCAVEPSAPFTRAMVAVAHYMPPPPFAGGSTGHFFVPYPPDGATAEQVRQRMSTNNRHGLWAITVHEAYPGHHWHFAHLATRATRPLRFLLGSAYFVEGWGLYTEELMREQGFYGTKEQELCQRDMRLFRAARIVVDTSLHLGEMTVEEAVEFMSTKASLSADTARAEVLRYCAMPTQASSYLTGALEIARLRERWLAEERGSLREFHDAAAGTGRLPVSLVERALFG